MYHKNMKLLHILSSLLFCLSFAASSTFADPAKVIIDTDFNTIGDDGQVAVMAAQLYAPFDSASACTV
jgi:hypothetical protein